MKAYPAPFKQCGRRSVGFLTTESLVRGIAAANSFPSPLVGEGGECGAIAKHEPGEGSVSTETPTPHPPSLHFVRSGTLSHKGRGKSPRE